MSYIIFEHTKIYFFDSFYDVLFLKIIIHTAQTCFQKGTMSSETMIDNESRKVGRCVAKA
jgi:hypothetical protein